jgi:hypothetical protein
MDYSGNIEVKKVEVIAQVGKFKNFIRKIKISLNNRNDEGKNR